MRLIVLARKLLNLVFLTVQIAAALAIEDGDDDTKLDEFSGQLRAKARGLPGRRHGSGTR